MNVDSAQNRCSVGWLLSTFDRVSELAVNELAEERGERRRWTNSPWQMHHLALFAGKPAALRERRRRTRRPIASLRAIACARFGGNGLRRLRARPPRGASVAAVSSRQRRDFSVTITTDDLSFSLVWLLIKIRACGPASGCLMCKNADLTLELCGT